MQRILLFLLLLTPFAVRGQDNCANATPLCSTSSINGTTAGATASASDPALSCGDLTVNNSVWFSVLAISAGTVTVTVSNIDNNPGLAMQAYSGACGSLVSTGACNSANGPAGSMSITFAVAANTTYYIMIDGQAGNQESFSITATSGTNSVVGRPVAVVIPNPSNGCTPLSVFLHNQSTLFGGTNITYQWRVLPAGSYISSSGADTTMLISVPGAYQVELRVCNAECGCNSNLTDINVQDLVPTIGFSPPNACLNTPIAFTGNATIQPPPGNPNVTSWTWNFGDPNSGANNTSNIQNPNHTFVGPGTSFNVRLIVDGQCGPDTATVTVNLHARPRVTVTPANQTVCQGSPLTLSASTTNATAPVSYTWSGPPTIVSPNSATTAITGLGPGPFVYSIHIVDSNNCVADTTTNVTVRPKPVINAGPDDTVCVNTFYTLQGSLSAGLPPITYSWTPAAGLSSSTILTPTTTLTTQHTYCLSARDSFGCRSDTDCVTLSVFPRPTVSSSPSFLCISMNPPLQTTFTVAGAGAGSTYSWKLSPSYARITGSNSDSSAVTATFPSVVASYNFTVVVFNPTTGCHDTLTTSFNVVSGISVTSGTSRTICQGQSAPLTASGATTYLWTASPAYAFADPTQANQSVSPAVTTTFIIRGTTGSCYEEDTIVITVRPKPVVNAGPDDTVCVNTPYALQGSLVTGLLPITYSWTPATGLSSSTVLTPNAIISAQRTYCLSARDSFGCLSDTDCVTLSVYPRPTVSASPSTLCASMNPPLQTTFTVNGGGAGSTYRWRLSANYSLISGTNVDSSIINVTFPTGVAAAYSFRVMVFNPATGCTDTVNVSFSVTAGVNMTTTSNQILCAGDSTTLTANGATTYLWSAAPPYPFGNPTNASQTVLPAATTTFIVRGTTGTCYDEDTVTVTVRPKPVVNAGPDDTICAFTPTPMAASVTVGVPPFTYLWSPSTGLSSATVLNPTVSTNITRSYCLYARDSVGCQSDTNCVTLFVYPKPQITSSSVLCASQAPPFTATFNVTGAGAGSTYAWRLSANFALITSAAPDSSSITATLPTGVAGTYSFTAIVIDGVTGCHDTVTTSFTVSAGLNMTVSPSVQLCTGSQTTLSANGATTYAWTASPAYVFADSTQAIQNVSPTGSTTFYVTGTTGTCSDIDTIDVIVNPKPSSIITPPPAFCRCDTVVLDGSASTPGDAYLWTSTNGSTIINSTSMVAFAVICGDDSIRLRVVNPATGCRDSSIIHVAPNPAPVATATVNPNQICNGVVTTVNLNGTAPGGLTYAWTSSPAVSITDSSQVVTTAFPSSATVFSLTVTDGLGCDTTVSDTVQVYPIPSLTASPPFLCTTDTLLQSTISVSGEGAGSLYSWDVIPSCVTPQTPSGASQLFDFGTCGTGTFGFTVTVTDGITSCVNTVSTNVGVVNGVSLTVTPDPDICEGDSVMLVAAGANAFLWNTGDVNDTIYVGDTLLASATPYDFIVTGTIGSCVGSDTVHVTVHPRPVAPVITGPSSYCENQAAPAVYIITSAPGVTYTWMVSGGTIVSGVGTDTLSVQWPGAGSGTVSVYDTNAAGCGGPPATLNVTIQALPALPVISGPDTVCQDDIVVYHVTPVAGLQYYWWTTNGAIIGSATADSVIMHWVPAGSGQVFVQVMNPSNCYNSDTLNIEVLPTPSPNFITGNIAVCENDTNQLYTVNAVPGDTFQWVIFGGTIVSGQGNDSIYVNWGTAGIGLLQMVERGANGCEGDTNFLNVNLSQQPVVNALPDSMAICNNQPVQLAGTSTAPTIHWITSGTGTFSDSTILSPVYTPSAADTGYIYLALVGSSPPCPDDTDVVVLYVSLAPVASIVSASGGTLCYGSTDTLTGGGIGSYLWLPDSVSTPVLIAAPTDTTDYALIVTNSYGCSDTATIRINVIPPGIPNGGPDQWICTGDSVLLNGTVQNAGGMQWSTTGDGYFSPDSFAPAAVYHPGLNDTLSHFVTLYLTSLGACLNHTDTIDITITPYPTVFAGNDTSLTANAVLPLHGIVTGGYGLWYTTGTGNFVPQDTVLNATYEPSPSDYNEDSIIIYLESTWACRTVVDSFVVRFVNFEIPNVFTPYPASPGFNDYFFIRGLPPGSALKIWDRWGLLVYQTDNYRNDWDAAELKSDSYYYILTTPDKEYHGTIKVFRDEK